MIWLPDKVCCGLESEHLQESFIDIEANSITAYTDAQRRLLDQRPEAGLALRDSLLCAFLFGHIRKKPNAGQSIRKLDGGYLRMHMNGGTILAQPYSVEGLDGVFAPRAPAASLFDFGSKLRRPLLPDWLP